MAYATCKAAWLLRTEFLTLANHIIYSFLHNILVGPEGTKKYWQSNFVPNPNDAAKIVRPPSQSNLSNIFRPPPSQVVQIDTPFSFWKSCRRQKLTPAEGIKNIRPLTGHQQNKLTGRRKMFPKKFCCPPILNSGNSLVCQGLNIYKTW